MEWQLQKWQLQKWRLHGMAVTRNGSYHKDEALEISEVARGTAQEAALARDATAEDAAVVIEVAHAPLARAAVVHRLVGPPAQEGSR